MMYAQAVGEMECSPASKSGWGDCWLDPVFYFINDEFSME